MDAAVNRAPGNVIGGRYRLVKRLGRGGMAEVWQAHQESLDRNVAIKFLHPFLAEDLEFQQRFQREARHVAALNHPNILQVYDFAQEGGQEGDVFYMVTEFVDGLTLQQRIRVAYSEGQRPAVEEVVAIGRAVANALHYAHERQVVHRDIKPGNVMLDRRGRVVLTDFGIARMLAGPQVTATGGMSGTPAYLAPERGVGLAGDARADIYSFGVLMYELATGQLPFEADSPVTMLLMHVSQPVRPPRLLNPALPIGLERIILKAMAKLLQERYQTMEEVAADLGDLEGAAGLEIPASVLSGVEAAAVKEQEGRPVAVKRVAVRPGDTPATQERELTPLNNLSTPLSSFIGREAEVAAVCELLGRPEVRLVTLTGPGGTGKTRLSLQVAMTILAERTAEAVTTNGYRDGVFFVALDAIREAELVAPAMAQALAVQESGGQTVEESLKGHLRGRQVLMVLDNFEQVLAAAPMVAALLGACPGVKVVATSRSPLHVYGEQEFPVPPLAVPEVVVATAEAVAGYGAVALFVERARAVRPGFALNDENAAAVAEICARLDGLPLAIELAAARVKLFSPQALLTRLGSALQLLTGGARDLPARQQTLRGAIDWSFGLLDEREKGLFARLAVFVGHYSLEAVEAVIGDWRLEIRQSPISNLQSPISILDGVASLLDKSLLKTKEGPEGEARFWMLETIHEYALERLAERGEVEALRRSHADYYLAIAETAGQALLGSGQAEALRQLEGEHDHLRAALRWALDGGEVEVAVRFASALWRFWHARSYLSEGRNWLRAVRAAVEEKSEERGAKSEERGAKREERGARREERGEKREERGEKGEERGEKREERASLPADSLANIYNGSGVLAYYQGDYELARHHYEQCLALRRDMEDMRGVAAALNNLGLIAYDQGEYERATAVFEESLGLFRQMAYQRGIAAALDNLGLIAYGLGDYERARALCEESLGLRLTIGDKQWVAITLNLLGNIGWAQGEYGRAAALYEQSLGLFQEVGDRVGVARVLSNLGREALSQGNVGAALAYYGDSLRLLREVRDRQGSIQGIEGLAGVLARQGQASVAACLLGAAEGLRRNGRLPLPPSERPGYEQVVAAVRAELDEVTLQVHWNKGAGMALAEAVALALEAAGGGE